MSRLRSAIDKTIALKAPINLVKDGKLNIVVLNSSDNRINKKF